MPDLTVEVVAQCKQLDYWQGDVGGYYQEYLRGEWRCTCTGFKFRHNCKHIKEAASQLCSWHGAYDEAQEQEGVCPRCGGETMYVRVAV